MKKAIVFVWMLMLLLACVPACAQEYVLGDEGNGYFVCEEFSGELTRKMKAACPIACAHGRWRPSRIRRRRSMRGSLSIQRTSRMMWATSGA